MSAQTTRQQIVALLQQERLGVKDLSRMLGIPEKDVFAHLEHIARTARRRGYRLEIEPGASCLACGFAFKERARFSSPGRCPLCRATHIAEPLYHLIRRP